VRGVLGNLPGEPPSGRRLPGWLQGKLFERRIIFVTGRLDDAVAAQTAAEIMTLGATGDRPIDLYLDSSDGTLEAAFILIDTVNLLHTTLRAHCRGQVGGPAIGVLAAADHRSAGPHTRFRLAQPTAQFSGTADQIASHTQAQKQLLGSFLARLARTTGRPAEEIAEDMRRGRCLDVREALEYGLIDAISATRP
jgi:ATP-dependent Clp protease protease subunit